LNSPSQDSGEDHGGPEVVNEKTPLGIRITLQFLRLLMVVMVVPLVASALLAIMSLFLVTMSSLPASGALILSAVGVGSFVLVLTTLLGATWLECHLNQSAIPFASSWFATRPQHPARLLSLPALGSIAFYGYAAVVLWTAANLGPGPLHAPVWPILWGIAAVSATVLRRHLNAKLPA
jgi:hypothetical protein